MRHFLDVDDLSCEELEQVLLLADPQVTEPAAGAAPRLLAGQGVALVFEKPSARTRSSSELAVVALGGHPVYIQGVEVGIGARESAEDVARTLSCYHAAICARVLDHGTVVRMAAALDAEAGRERRGPDDGVGAKAVPVVNLLSDLAHPCQAVADLLTLRQVFGADLGGRSLAYIGDANNVWRSLAKACAMVGMRMRVACPDGFGPDVEDLAVLSRLGAEIEVSDDPRLAAAGADALYTDVWTSMGQEEESAMRRKAFDGFSIDAALLAVAGEGAVVLHCLPAHRGEEISHDVLESPASVVWRQAANRMHAMRGILSWVLTAGSLNSTGAERSAGVEP
jgi:ornithine carbamoyltransferase